ncbi:hypothetical protein ABH931_004621 [Streptacidiphilus sp. MAP12-33]|uniref:DUF2397 family protein n=1 Tax=Streptacidiphilus sp. MAP12-33 TaxID=3156266 RepID=UPI003515AD0F
MSSSIAPQPFAYLQAPNAALYGQVLAVFAAARERFIVHLRPEDVAAELRRDARPDRSANAGVAAAQAVGDALEQLVAWGNLRSDADTGRVR